MELLINRCWGGFGVSPRTLWHTAQLKEITIFPYLDELHFGPNGEISRTFTKISDINSIKRSLTTDVTFLQKNPGKDILNGDVQQFDPWDFYPNDHRSDKELIAAVKADGELANTPYNKPRVVIIPDGFDYKIDDYDGMESVYVGKELRIIDGEEDEVAHE